MSHYTYTINNFQNFQHYVMPEVIVKNQETPRNIHTEALSP